MTHGEAFGQPIIAHLRSAFHDSGADHFATIPFLQQPQVTLVCGDL
jgi:hypothetical protein